MTYADLIPYFKAYRRGDIGRIEARLPDMHVATSGGAAVTGEQREALYIARYALDRVVNVHLIAPDEEGLPASLAASVQDTLDEIDEALPVGDLGERPVPLTREVMDEVERLR